MSQLTEADLAERLDNGMTRVTWMRASAYGYIPPVIPKGERFSASALAEIRTRISIASSLGVITRSTRAYKTAKDMAAQLRAQLDRAEFVVKIEPGIEGNDLVVYSRAYIDSLPPKPIPWHASYDPAVWMDFKELMAVLGVRAIRAGVIVKQHGIKAVVWNNRGARVFERRSVDRAVRARYAARFNERGEPRKGFERAWRPTAVTLTTSDWEEAAMAAYKSLFEGDDALVVSARRSDRPTSDAVERLDFTDECGRHWTGWRSDAGHIDLTMLPPTFAAVTSWNARRQHLVRDNAPDMLCARGTVVRPGEQHAGEDQSPMTQERIDAMPLCQACNASRRRIESESQP